jgi:hypothetical protein
VIQRRNWRIFGRFSCGALTPCESGEAAAIAVALTDLYAAGATRDINASVLPSPSSKNVIHSSVPVSSSV